ncbi:recombinase family protein [Isosphaeraceae bacterium EP7]
MNGSTKILPTHRQRQAVVYLRQSTPKQVLKNCESAANQRALRGRLLEWGWRKDQIVLIDEDQAQSAKQVAGRDGFQRLVADVSLRKVGLIIGTAVSRLSRNCADWHRLLELCGLFDTLIADAEGIYNPRDFNDRLLLGLKGTLSEAELHSIRLRMDAGRLSKAGRGELVQHLPTGYVRDTAGVVRFDPDQSVRDRIQLVFAKFGELGSAQKVLRYMAKSQLKLPRRQTSGLYAGTVLWKEPTSHVVLWLLKNPAYAGAFAYGRRIVDATRQVPGRPATGRIRQPRDRWLALVKGVYPAYITWEEHERILVTIEENRQKMAERLTRKQAIRCGEALLTGLVRCGRCGHAMQVIYKDNRFQYVCNVYQSLHAKPNCQHIGGRPIDEAVVREFFKALRPAEIDALESVNAKQLEHQRELERHMEQEVRRLEYAARRAERQYDSVDPENRLIASTLESRWEAALVELEQAKTRLTELKSRDTPPVAIPESLRTAFADVGRRLPDIWARLPVDARKTMLRTLVAGVNLDRDTNGIVRMRIVWSGGLVTETSFPVAMSSFRSTERETHIVERIRRAVDEGRDDATIAERLNVEGLRPCRRSSFTPAIVGKLRRRHRILSRLERLRRGEPMPGYTTLEMARLIGVDRSWISRKISRGQILLEKDACCGCYLFPRTRSAIEQMKRLKEGKVPHVSFPKEHCDG